MTGIQLTNNFNEDALYEYHQGTFECEDTFYDYVMQYIDNEVIYTHKAKEICETLTYDVFQEHDLWGKHENWSQAAYAALYDHLYDTMYTFLDIEDIVKNEKNV